MKPRLVAALMSILTTTCLSNSGTTTSVLERLPRGKEEEGGKERGGSYRHPYLQEEFYARIAGLDLSETQNIEGGKSPTIGVIEAKSSKCHLESNGLVTLEFPLSETEVDQSEVVISLDAIGGGDATLVSCHVVSSSSIARKYVLPEPRNNSVWIVFHFRKLPPEVAGSGVLVVDLNITGAYPARRRICEGLKEKPPTLFLYRHFPPLPPPPPPPPPPRGSNPRGQRSRRSVPSHRSDCHLHPWTVDFDAIGMKRIIAPSLFKVNYCHGTCSDPSWTTAGIVPRQTGQLTNHALLLVRAQAAATPSPGLPAITCQPTAYESMNIIYLDDGNTVRVGTFEQMVAASCGCGCK